MTLANTASGPHAATNAGLFSALAVGPAWLAGSGRACLWQLLPPTLPPQPLGFSQLTYHLGQSQSSETRFSLLAPKVCSVVIHPQIFFP